MQSKLRIARLAPSLALALLASCGDYSLPDGGAPDLSVPQCGLGATMCGGECVDTGTDKRHCGGCGMACAPGFGCIAGACKLTCDTGLTACVMQGICTDLQTDPHNCGTCGVVCLDNEVCASGRCTAACPSDSTNCSRSCVDLNSDRNHCGNCGTMCPPGNACIQGSCTLMCPMDLTNCRGACTDTGGDAQNCGGCGNVCPMGQSCSNSQCAPHCTQGTTDCNGFCANLSNDIHHCGACNIACANGEVCSNGRCAGMCDPGLAKCGLRCSNLQNDNANCGACGKTCALGTVCTKGTCQPMCSQGETDCNGVCADITSDNGNCGACGMACPPGNLCAAGKCVGSCPAPLMQCGQSCRNFTNDVQHCGKCGAACPPVSHGIPSCVNAACAVGMCDAGWADCDKNYANGCEVNLATDARNCGSCGGACQPVPNSTVKCAASLCALDTCNNGYADCNGKLADGCEVDVKNDPNNCSLCGMACPAPKFATAGCKNGICGVGTCNAGYDDCNGQSVDGCEVDTQNDPKNCGACARGCGPYPHGVPGCGKGACTVKCEAGWADCNNNLADGCETDLSSVKTCGSCNLACPAPTNGTPGCMGGVCGVGMCVGGFADCDTVAANGCEINTGTDKLNCGKCGNICTTPPHGSPICNGGNCSFTCTPPWNDCDGNPLNGCETDTSTAANACGACGRACTAPNATTNCAMSVCGIQSCQAGFGDCDKQYANGCEQSLNVVNNCGACGVACPVPANATAGCTMGVCGIGQCVPGFADCNGQGVDGCEVNTQLNVNNCGKCGAVCPAVAHGNPACAAGNCGYTCVAPFNDCDGIGANGCETDTSANALNCGGCGRVCTAPNATTNCANSVCGIAACNAGFGDCDKQYINGCEVQLNSIANCGGCGVTCAAPPNATASCTNGVCGVGSCAPGFADCDGNPANGCEVNTQTTVASCGRCGNVCPPVSNGSPICTAGNCSFTCTAPWNDCDANPLNGCETNTSSSTTSCGTCGKVCAAANAVTSCTNAACGIAACNAGFGDCNKTYADGCEVSLATTQNCGACGNVCPAPANASATCVNGVCGIGGCNAGFADCNGNVGDGCETNTQTSASHCSRCGNVCPTPPHATPVCTNSACSFTCVGTWADCDGNAVNGCETDTSTTVSSCGSCGKACNAANAVTQCAAAACGIASCNPGFANCNNSYGDGCEVSTNLDPANCGGCGKACAAVANGAPACVAGACQIGGCNAGFADCNKQYVDGCEVQTATNVNNCGGCGTICPSVAHSTPGCANGLCNFACDVGFADCDKAAGNGCETTLATDPNNCGACNNACPIGPNGVPLCVAGKCALNCGGTFRDCDGNAANGCETNSAADVNNCGACGKACPNPGNAIPTCGNSICGFTCLPGFSDCDGNPANGCEVNLNSNSNCGGCGKVCPAFNNAVGACVAGQCSFTCNAGWGDCDGLPGNGCESNIATDANNCGRCTQVCSTNNMATRTCGAGTCNGACNAGYADCNNNKLIDGCEINLLSDANNCGGCGTICSANNMATRTCGGGTCNGTCNAGFANCDGNLQTNGCEINLQTDPNNCGGCTTVCSSNNMATRTCGGGACNGSCNAGFANCDGNLQANGCEINTQNDPNNCGGCGTVCSGNNMASRTCGGGSCNGACNALWGDCNGNKQSDGCETPLTSLANCGGCGTACTTPNATPTCGTGTCAIASCNANFFNVDGAAGNGCECAAPSTNTCGGAISLGTIAWGGSTTQTGTIPGTQAERWYVVAWNNSGVSYHPHVTITTTGGSSVLFDVYGGGCAGLTATGCAVEGGSSTSRTDWEVNQTAGDPSGGGTQGAFVWPQPGGIGQLSPGTQIWIRVRGTNAGSCSSYSLVVKNG